MKIKTFLRLLRWYKSGNLSDRRKIGILVLGTHSSGGTGDEPGFQSFC